jgi:murein L,D-transpeptidase YafK
MGAQDNPLRPGCGVGTITLMKHGTGLVACLLIACVMVIPAAAEETDVERWLLVDTVNNKLMIMEGSEMISTYEGIAIGRYGAAPDRMQGDHRTPVGRFRVAWISEDTRFHRFFGLDYPDLLTALRAYTDKRITEPEWQAIRRAHQEGAIPPQNTPLGGQIGLHGIGAGSAEVHGRYNWTNGCVALGNDEIDELLQWVRVGTRVDIR